MKVIDKILLSVFGLFPINLYQSFFHRITDVFCDLPLGLFIVRGDNIVVFGELDNEKEASSPLTQVSQEILMEKMANGKKTETVEWNLE